MGGRASMPVVPMSKPAVVSYLLQRYMRGVNQVVILAGKAGMTLLTHNEHNICCDIIGALQNK